MKTIMHIAEAFGGGIVTFLANLANMQAEHYNVIIVHGIRPETHKNYKDFFDPRIQLINARNFRQRINLGAEVKAIIELRGLIKQYKPDVIHMHSSQAGVLGKLAALGYSCPKVYSPHGFSFLRKDTSSWKIAVFKAIEKAFGLLGSIVVASSKTEFLEAQKITKKSILICNGINCDSLTPYLRPTPTKETIWIGMVGRALSQKNPSMFNAIAEQMPHVHFEWIGDGALRYQLKAPNIHIVGWGPREEALDYVSKCDIYIMTSLWEGMPLSLLEAMFLGKPCVVTNVVGNRDVINNDKNGYVCNDVNEFVEKLQYLIDHPDKRNRLGIQCHNDVKSIYNSRIMEQHFSEAYFAESAAIRVWHQKDQETVK